MRIWSLIGLAILIFGSLSYAVNIISAWKLGVDFPWYYIRILTAIVLFEGGLFITASWKELREENGT